MEEWLRKLHDVLKKQLATYEDFLSLLNSKIDQIMSRELKAIEKTAVEELKLISILDKLEKERLAIVNERFGSEASRMTLKQIIETLVPGDMKKMFEELRLQILDTVEEIKNANEIIFSLIKQSLEVIDFTVGLILKNTKDKITYTTGGGKNDVLKGPLMLDLRA